MSCVRPVSAPSCETAGIHLQVLGPTGDLHCSNCCCCLHACVHIWAPGQVLGIRAQLQAPRFSHLLSFLPLGSVGLLVVLVGEEGWGGGGGKAGTGHRGSLWTAGRACESNFPVVTVLPVSAERPAWGLQSKCDSAMWHYHVRAPAPCSSSWRATAIDCADGFYCHCEQPTEQTLNELKISYTD